MNSRLQDTVMANKAIKTIIDYGIACLGLLVTSPLLLILSVIIYFDSPGPILHRRRVMGQNRSQFDAFKFRSMYSDPEKSFQCAPAGSGKGNGVS